MATLATYSGKDVNVTITSPLSGPIQAAGVSSNGLAQISVRMTVDQSFVEAGMDGSIIPSVLPGDQGEFELQVFQTSTLQQQLLALWNAQKAAEIGGDVTSWFGATVFIQAIVGAASHTGTGCAITKFPDKGYGAQAQRVTWVIRACNLTNQ